MAISPLVLVFLAVMLVGLGAGSILADVYLRDRTRVKQRVADEFGTDRPERAKRSPLFRNLDPALPGLAVEEEHEAPGLQRRFEMMVQQSGLQITPGQVLLISAL